MRWLSTRDRLLPVTCLRFDDIDWAVGELKRMRERGSRAFLISSEPAGGIPPSSPAFDPVWAAATELGMVPLLHIGMSPAMIHPGWANTDDPALIRLLSILQPEQSAEVFLSAMIIGGAFERHPTLTVLISELGIDWLPRLARRLDSFATEGASPLVLGEYTLPLLPSEYIGRNVRISPLPAPHQSPLRLMEHLPGVAVFSSDFPHFEGSGEPLPYYEALLADVDDDDPGRFPRWLHRRGLRPHGRPAVSAEAPSASEITELLAHWWHRYDEARVDELSEPVDGRRHLPSAHRHRHHRLRSVRPRRLHRGRGDRLLAGEAPRRQSAPACATWSSTSPSIPVTVTRRTSRRTCS